ncbi:heterokaryon incompatibility protein-domain-containing protein [Echria macrotheca]|uniref:Heterokaryon incompatibility protein-domain-containing protein n=1 Tax=Echria macrotheca TaxID=438768 RepID=A0AAJ0BFZ1_9PEZI|nr:heterokaryon incompatibility protein-domain-containing protein [Echria macrotheca]
MANPQIASIPCERQHILYESSGELFRYPPLVPNSARFLSLQPSPNGTDALSCTFMLLPLSPDTQYEVLSGFWGDSSSFQPVFLMVNGRSCKTTPKLAQALYRFRHRDQPRLLWIQSLCIDPKNVSERNTQVARLRDILESAQRLIIWLGGAEDDSDAVFDHLNKFRHLVTEKNWPRPPLPDPLYGRRELPYRTAPECPALPDHIDPYPEEAAAAFTKLCLRPWFYRPWAIPELALSQRILLVCGDHQLQQVPWWNPIAMLVEAHHAGQLWLTTPSRTSLLSELNILPADPISHISSLAFHAKSPASYAWDGLDFENAYRIVRNCHATDRRDSVFAIAALASVPPINVDYSLSTSDVYQQATFALMQRHHSIQILRRLASPSRDPDLPSWTLDFNSPLETTGALWALPGARFLKDDQPYIRSIEQVDAKQRELLWVGGTQVPKARVEPGRLIITGRFMERIAAIGPIMPPAEDGALNKNALTVWEQLASRLQQTGKRFPQSIADAFLDTIMANDAHDVLRNNPPRPLVSHVAGRARRWYERHGAGHLQQADPEYFRENTPQPTSGSGYASGDLEQVFMVTAKEEDEESSVGRRIARACQNKRFFTTDRGSLGLAPAPARDGDVAVFLPTGLFPLFLRPQDEDAKKMTYKLLGEGFLYDWWAPHMAPVFQHRINTGQYGDLLTQFVFE